MYYARAICRRVNPKVFGSSFGDDAGGPVTQRGGIGTFENVGPSPSTQNVQEDVIAAQQAAQAAQEQAAATLKYAHDNPFAFLSPSNPLGLPPGVGPRINLFPEDKTPSGQRPAMSPWVKGGLIIGAIGVTGYALSQVANVGKVIRG